MTNQSQNPVVDFQQSDTSNTHINTNNDAKTPALPKHGVSRERQLLPFLPFSATTLWKWSKEGKFIQPVKLSPTITVWDNSKVHKWLELIAQGYDPELATQLAADPSNKVEGA